MADSGIRHIVSTIPVPQSEFEDEAFHALIHGTTFPAAPTERQLYYRDDTHKWYIYNGTVWKESTGGDADIATHAAIAAAHHAKYTDAEAKAAAVQAGAITDGVTKAPTHDAVYDVKVTADAAQTAAEVDADIATHAGIAAAHHTKTVDASELSAGELPAARLSTNIKTLSLTFIIDGGGSAITVGEKGHLEIPFACTITRVTALADVSGSIVVDIWKDTYANFPPTDADSITAAAPPTITTAQKSQDSTLTGWTTAITAGDILAFNVDSITTITRVTISLKVEKS